MLRPVRERHGDVTYGILIIIVLSGVYSGCDKHSLLDDAKWKSNADTGKLYQKKYVTALIKSNSLFKVYIGITYIRREKDGEPVPLEAVTYVNGTLSGVEWRPLNILAYTSGHTIFYQVNEEEKWTLARFPVFIRAAILKGELMVE